MDDLGPIGADGLLTMVVGENKEDIGRGHLLLATREECK
jgi:hypothetical protein